MSLIKKIINTGLIAATAVSISLAKPQKAIAADTNASVSQLYQQVESQPIHGTRIEAENNGFLMRADHIFDTKETTKWGVILPYRINDIVANIELFGLDNNAGQNGLGTRARFDYKKFGIGGIFQNYRANGTESQLFGPQFFLNLNNLVAQAGVYNLESRVNGRKTDETISNGIFNFNFGRQVFGLMWKASEKDYLVGAGTGLATKKTGEGFGYLIYGEYSPNSGDFESLHLLWGNKLGKKCFVPAFGITDDGDSEVTLFPVETDFQYNVAGVDLWTLPWFTATKAAFRFKHIGGKNSDTFVEEAAVFPFNLYDDPEFLKKLFIGGIGTQTRANGKTKNNLTGAIGYSYGSVQVYITKTEGKIPPAGYITFRKEF